MKVAEIILHQDWKSYTTRYDGDVAILVIEKDVEFTSMIQPICLPSVEWKNMELVNGTVAGWGFSEKNDRTAVEAVLKKTLLNAPPTNEECFLKDKALTELSSTRTYCGGGSNSGPCKIEGGKYKFLLIYNLNFKNTLHSF
jgi:hypothetical protein